MGKATLVKADIDGGRALIEELRRSAVPVAAGMWLLMEDGYYKLYIATPLVQIEGPLRVYNRLDSAISLLPEDIRPKFEDVVVANSANSFVNSLSTMLSNGNELLEARDVDLNDMMIKHAVVYRVDRSEADALGSKVTPNRATTRGKAPSGPKRKQRRAIGKGAQRSA